MAGDRMPKKFSEVYKGELKSDGQLTELVGQNFIIKAVEVGELSGKLGEYAIATVQAGDKTMRLHTFSKVLIKQLKAVKPYVDKGEEIEATIRKIKNYYTLE
jgi:hypothetical protein